MIEITKAQCMEITTRMCAAYLDGEAGRNVTHTAWCAMADYERDAYQMGADMRRKLMMEDKANA